MLCRHELLVIVRFVATEEVPSVAMRVRIDDIMINVMMNGWDRNIDWQWMLHHFGNCILCRSFQDICLQFYESSIRCVNDN